MTTSSATSGCCSSVDLARRVVHPAELHRRGQVDRRLGRPPLAGGEEAGALAGAVEHRAAGRQRSRGRRPRRARSDVTPVRAVPRPPAAAARRGARWRARARRRPRRAPSWSARSAATRCWIPRSRARGMPPSCPTGAAARGGMTDPWTSTPSRWSGRRTTRATTRARDLGGCRDPRHRGRRARRRDPRRRSAPVTRSSRPTATTTTCCSRGARPGAARVPAPPPPTRWPRGRTPSWSARTAWCPTCSRPRRMTAGMPPRRPRRGARARPGRFAYDTMTLVGPGTWEAARRGRRLRADGGRPGRRRRARLAYALCRPPGHHATPAGFGGSCYLNNAAVAAEALRARGARPGRRSSTSTRTTATAPQAIFYERADVLYGSVHVDPGAGWFPHVVGYADETGAGDGAGATRNLPLPEGTGDDRGWSGGRAGRLGRGRGVRRAGRLARRRRCGGRSGEPAAGHR